MTTLTGYRTGRLLSDVHSPADILDLAEQFRASEEWDPAASAMKVRLRLLYLALTEASEADFWDAWG